MFGFILSANAWEELVGNIKFYQINQGWINQSIKIKINIFPSPVKYRIL